MILLLVKRMNEPLLDWYLYIFNNLISTKCVNYWCKARKKASYWSKNKLKVFNAVFCYKNETKTLKQRSKYKVRSQEPNNLLMHIWIKNVPKILMNVLFKVPRFNDKNTEKVLSTTEFIPVELGGVDLRSLRHLIKTN